MKPAAVPELMIVERPTSNVLPLMFIAVLCFSGGFLAGDWTAEPRFAEREASIRQYAENARIKADRIREQLTSAIKKGCLSFVDPDRPASARWLPKEQM